MLGCACQQQSRGEQEDALALLPMQLRGATNDNLMFYIQGVRTGLQIKAAEQAKWQRLGVMLALTFGVLTFLNRFTR